jgi:hypothetical protein
LLAKEYHQRWEIENTIDELKTHLNGRKTPIRSLKPREVVQEIYGWLLGHYAVRCLMFQSAQLAGISPLRLGFTALLMSFDGLLVTFRMFHQSNSLFFYQVIMDILAEEIPPRQGRSNPRVVKKPRSKFPSKKPIHKGTGVKFEPFTFSILSTA